MSALDSDSLPDYQALLVVAAVMTVVTAAVLLSDSVRNGLIVLSAPIGIGALLLAIRIYLAN